MEPPAGPPPVSYERLLGILSFSALLGLAFGVAFYRHWIYDQRMSNDSGFNVNSTASSAAQLPTLPTESQPAPSSLTMIQTGPLGHELAGQAPAQPGGASRQPAQNLTEAIRKSESRVQALAIRYTLKYPVIQEYGQDWASYPDLYQYNSDYLEDGDPIKFAYHVASSKNFAALVKKYAGRPEILQFVQDVVKTAPPELFNATREFLSQDAHGTALLKRFTSAIGLPDSLVNGLISGSASPNQATSVFKTDPKLKELLQQDNINPNEINRGFKNQ